MILIPDKNLFIVTSSLKPKIGAFTDEQRLEQTILTLQNIRKTVLDTIIVFADCSCREVTQNEKKEITDLVDYYIDCSSEPNCNLLSLKGLKSLAECFLLLNVLILLKQNHELSKRLLEVKRIFKISGRTILTDDFDINDYDNLFGKFVFKKRIPTWLTDKSRVDHLLITRLYSFCPSLIEEYIMSLQKNIQLLQSGIVDFEHAHYLSINKDYLVEFDNIHCYGWLSGNGTIEHY